MSRVYVFVAIVWFGLCATAAAQQGGGTLSGVVIDRSGGVVIGAQVELIDRNGTIVGRGSAGTDGRFSLSAIAPGPHRVRVRLTPFQLVDSPVTIEAGGTTELRVVMEVAGLEEQVSVSAALSAAPSTAEATKANTPIYETPVSLQTVTRQTIDEQQAIRPKDVIKNVSGVQSAFGFGYLRDRNVIRGFETDAFPQGGSYLDGVLQFEASNSLANVERVEVLKGASALLFGRMQPGGLINYVTKRPLPRRGYAAQQQAGSFGNYRTTFDATGPVVSSGRVLYRFNAEYLDSDSFRDVTYAERLMLAPSVTVNVSDRTQFDVDVIYQDDETANDYGLPAYGTGVADVPVTRNFGEPTNRSTGTVNQQAATLSHRFNPRWSLKAKASRYAMSGHYYETAIEFLDDATGIGDRWLYDAPVSVRGYFATADLNGTIAVGNTVHALLFGTDAYRRRYREDGVYVSPCCTETGVFPTRIDIFNPIYGYDEAAVLAGQPRSFTERHDWWTGFYAQDQITLGAAGRWHVLIGGRFDHAISNRSLDEARTVTEETEDNRFSPRAGVLFEAAPWLHVFANHGRAFGGPNIGVNAADGSALPSRTSRQTEGGVKLQGWGGRASGSVVLFDLTLENIANPISIQPGAPSQLSGEARSRGLEVDATVQVTAALNLLATYTHLDATLTRDLVNQGNRLGNAAEHMGSLWAQYRFDEGLLPGLSIGGGLFAIGDRAGDRSNSFVIPGYTRLDLSASYRRPVGRSALVFQLNAENLTDERYFLSAGAEGYQQRISTMPGSPRAVLGSIRVEF